MKVKCINNKNGALNLTVGKIYEVLEDYDDYYVVRNDRNERTGGIFKTRFEIVDEEGNAISPVEVDKSIWKHHKVI